MAEKNLVQIFDLINNKRVFIYFTENLQEALQFFGMVV